MRLATAAIPFLVCLGCSAPVTGVRFRGELSLVSTRVIPSFERQPTLGETEGKSCFGIGSLYGSDEIVGEAVTEAMNKYPNAQVLTDVSVRDVGDCVRVRGTARSR
jgi:hypothetical protein